ncbi:MAG: hypothetical protein M1817_002778 [Caeruleum heppii]|nr:MAG: hypothetical protein M1817_002778 [Caeruleum heppii]
MRPPLPSTQDLASRQSRKRRKVRDDRLDDDDGSVHHQFPTLQANVKRVPQHVVASKWAALPVPAQNRVADIFRAIERPVITRHKDERRRAEAQAALAPLLRTLRKKLPRMAFPAKTRDVDFDYERTLHNNRALEAQLNPALHSIGLLRARINRETALLEADGSRLERLGEEIEEQEQARNEQSEKVGVQQVQSASSAADRTVQEHSLLQLASSPDLMENSIETIGLTDAEPFPPMTLKKLFDEEPSDLQQQLLDHLESIQSNTAAQRPCTRCLKRDIGHLCHDEPREHSKTPKAEQDSVPSDDGRASPKRNESSKPEAGRTSFEPRGDGLETLDNGTLLGSRPMGPHPAGRVSAASQLPSLPSAGSASAQNLKDRQLTGYSDWSLGSHNQFHDMHTFHPSYMFNAPEVTSEYNLLNDFLSSSLLDEAALYTGEDGASLYPSALPASTMPANVDAPLAAPTSNQQQTTQLRPLPESTAPPSQAISRPASTAPSDRAREKYYLTAADPSGSDPPEERMNKLLKAKYEAGLLKPFNYINGYARLGQYMEKHMQPGSRQTILRQLDSFRPKFRERMQKLTDIELVLVEMWFERSLMEYDRVFASMAIPACCWRRTGEIFRANKEMAELIHEPIENLRDGKVALHEILEEDSIVGYWEKFGSIAFDSTQKAMLTSCYLQHPDAPSTETAIHCCFSFTVRRDTHNIPSLIVGNFLPINPVKH